MSQDGRALPHDALELLRLRAAEEFARKTPVSVVAAMVGMNRRTVSGWHRKWRDGGVDALAARPVPGRPAKLTDDQLRELAFMVRNHAPADYGLGFALWTRPLIGDLIERQFGHRFQEDWVGKVMRRIGFSPQRPVYRASQQDPEKVREWREQAYPAIKAEAAQVGATVYFGDEAHLRQDFHAGTTWAPLGETPVVESSAKRETVSMISAIEPRGSIHFSAFTGTCDAERFIEFCRRMLDDDGGTVFLILDNSPVHHSIAVREYEETTGGRLKLFFLPPYSPILNADEWVWKNIKNDRAGRQATRRPGDLFNFACRALDRLAGKPGIVRGFFGDPQLAYIT